MDGELENHGSLIMLHIGRFQCDYYKRFESVVRPHPMESLKRQPFIYGNFGANLAIS